MANLLLRHVYKIYPGVGKAKKNAKGEAKKRSGDFVAVKDFSMEINDGEFIVFVGPSGCGKSTTLRMIAGLEEITGGELYIDDQLVNDVDSKDRDIAMVFQSYALYPHLTAYDNIAFGLAVKKVPKKEIKERVTEMLRLVNLSGFERRNVNNLSGGQQQRVAIARALAMKPMIILADEPTGSLDSNSGKEVMNFMRELSDEGKTVIIITHDNAIAESTKRIIRISDGRIAQ